LKPAPGHYRVNGALGHEDFEPFVPVGIAGHLPLYDLRYLRSHVHVVNPVGRGERFSDVRGVFLPYLPDIRGLDTVSGLSGVLYVKDIFEARSFRVRPVYQGNALRAAFHPPAHPPVPEVYSGAGRRAGTLRVDERLIHERVFVHPGGAVEK
jgi:hypothetical protein